MRNYFTLVLALTAAWLPGQVTSIWIGDMPGHKTDWHQPYNWSNQRIPDEFTDVVIPLDETQSNNYPVYSEGREEINSLNIWPGAILQVRGGELIILDTGKNVYSPEQIKGSIRSGWKGYTLKAQDDIAGSERHKKLY